MVPRPQLLQERMGSVPASMRMSSESFDKMLDSFVNIFKAGASSLKLVGQNILFNARMAVAAMDGDRAKMQQAFSEYATARQQFAEEADKNLKYYRQAFYEEVKNEDGEVVGHKLALGPAMLVGIANPLLVPAMAWQPGRGFKIKGKSVDNGGSSPGTQVAPVPPMSLKGASDRLARALVFFEFGKRLAEAAQPNAVDPEIMKERQKLLQIAEDFVKGEQKRGGEILDMLMKRISFFKKVVESSTFEEFQAALEGASALGIKPITTGLAGSREKIEKDAREKMKSNPEEFKKFITDARKTYPDLDPKDDVKAVLEFSFRSAKSQIQQQLMSSYDGLIASVMSTMNLPLTPQLEAQLNQTPVGQRYLQFLKGFERQLETGKRELETAKKV